MWKVSYIQVSATGDYRVSRRFGTRDDAQEFIDANALVSPLPGVRLEHA